MPLADAPKLIALKHPSFRTATALNSYLHDSNEVNL